MWNAHCGAQAPCWFSELLRLAEKEEGAGERRLTQATTSRRVGIERRGMETGKSLPQNPEPVSRRCDNPVTTTFSRFPAVWRKRTTIHNLILIYLLPTTPTRTIYQRLQEWCPRFKQWKNKWLSCARRPMFKGSPYLRPVKSKSIFYLFHTNL